MKIEIPTNCPECDSKLVLKNTQLFCINSSCPAQSVKKIETFCKVMKIKGMGPKTVEKLDLKTIPEIYSLDQETLEYYLGKNGTKLFNEIEKSKVQDLATLLQAFSIPLVGNSASNKIAEVASSIEELDEAKLVEAGLGEKARQNVLTWIITEYLPSLATLPITINKPKKRTATKLNKKVCITGKLNDFKNRTEAKNYLESKGYTVVSSVTKNTDYLIDEEGKESSKRKQAEKLGITITTINNLLGETQ